MAPCPHGHPPTLLGLEVHAVKLRSGAKALRPQSSLLQPATPGKKPPSPIKKMWCTHTHSEILPNHRKEQSAAIHSNMDGPIVYHIKSVKQKDKEHVIPLIRGI